MKKDDARYSTLERLHERRKQVVRLHCKGYKVMQIVDLCGLSYPAVRAAIDRYKVGGLAAIKPAVRGRRAGQGRALNAEQEHALRKLICDKRPEQLKMEFALWSRAAVMQLIEQEYGIKLTVRGVGKYLARWGFTAQKPIKKAYEQRPEAVQAWLNEQYPEIEKRAKETLHNPKVSDNIDMKQQSLNPSEFSVKPKRTRKREFLDEMDAVVPWSDLVQLVEPFAPKPGAKGGRPAFPLQTMLRIHFMQQWFGLSDPAMEEALHDVPMYQSFAHLDAGVGYIPDESTILRFRHLLEQHKLAESMLATLNALLEAKGLLLKRGTVVDATIIAAPSSTKNSSGKRDPQMHQTKKGNQWHFGMKAHIGADAESGLVHTVVGAAANVHDVTQAHALLHGEETCGFGDAGYRGAEKREEVQRAHPDVEWLIAMQPGKRKTLNTSDPHDVITEQREKIKAGVRAKVEHPFRVIKRQFGYVKTRYRGLAKNTAQLITLFALSNIWMARRSLLQAVQG